MKIALLAAVLTVVASTAHAQVGAFETDCKLGGDGKKGIYQFVSTCAGRSLSPDGRLAIVQKAYDETQPPIELQDKHGRTLAKLPSLSDDMPFLVMWSPDSRWFLVNHHVGSFMDTLQVFEIVGQTAMERPALVRSAVRLASRRYPCLRRDMILPNGVRWSRDSRRIILVTISRPDACSDYGRRRGNWHSLWMIGDVDSGRIDRGSVKVQPDDKPLETPRTGVYATFSDP